MSDVFISYARSTEAQAQTVAEALRALGYGVWRDDELPAHRDYSEVIEERLRAAKAVVVVWCAEAVKSQWVRAEADIAREAGTLVQLSLDGASLPMPFNRVQCADLAGWSGGADHPGWRKIAASVAELVGGAPPAPVAAAPVAAAPLPLPSKPSIAVMPFANLSGDAEQDYFADGMVEEVTAALSRHKSIFVIGSSSTLSFKGKAASPQDVGRLLGVRYVLEGNVRKAADRVRIAVKLIDASDGGQIWSERFEDTLEDVFALQDKVALAVAAVIEPTVQTAEIRRAARRPTENLGSYDLYLRGVALYRTFAKAETLEALDLLHRANALDPDFAPALSLEAGCHRLIVFNSWSDDPDAHRLQGVALANRALKAGGDDAEVLAGCAFSLLQLEGDVDGAIALADRAIALNPGSSVVWLTSGLMRLANPDLAVEHMQTAIRLDPLGPSRPSQAFAMGLARFCQRRFDEAVAHLKDYVQQVDSAAGYSLLAASYGHLGQKSAAREAIAHVSNLTPALNPRSMPAEFLQLLQEGLALGLAEPSP